MFASARRARMRTRSPRRPSVSTPPASFPRACEKFGRAAADEPASTARRQDVVRCFEGWGWHALREGRPDEAALLFRQGLTETPDDPALLKGLGRRRRPRRAPGRRARAARASRPRGVRPGGPAAARAPARPPRRPRAGDREPQGGARARARPPRRARRLLDKVEREQRAEAGFRREITPRFVVKYREQPSTPKPGARSSPQLEAAAERVGADARVRSAAADDGRAVRAPRVPERDARRTRGPPDCSTGRSGSWSARVRPPARELERLVVHEYAHAAIHELSRGRAPRWLHEGLAQVLEGATPGPDAPGPRRSHAGRCRSAGRRRPIRYAPEPATTSRSGSCRTSSIAAGSRPSAELLDRLGAGETHRRGDARASTACARRSSSSSGGVCSAADGRVIRVP